MALHANKPEYVDTEESVRYLDGSALKRPFEMPPAQRIGALAFLVAALAIGAFFGYQAIDKVVAAPAREAATVEENLGRAVNLDLPGLTNYVGLTREDVTGVFSGAGYVIYDMTDEEIAAAGVGYDIMKLPSDVAYDDALVLYAQGIKNLSAADAAKLLNGSWRITSDTSEGTDLRVRYADFSSGTVETAVQAAIVSQGLEATAFGESGVDGSGNTYQAGTVDVGGTVYNWQVSACPLSGVYSIDGLPDSSVYVGIRLYS